MAKRPPPTGHGDLFASVKPTERVDLVPSSEPLGAIDPQLLSSFDDYDEGEHHLRLVDPPRESPRVIVEAVEADCFEVSRLRDNGTTVANVRWTRKELEELVMRAQSALEM